MRQNFFGRSAYSLLVMASLAVGLGSCTQSAQESAQEAADSTELQIVTTTLPVTNFTKAVAGDRAEVTYLLPTNVGPHDYQAKPADAQTIAAADVLVENGLGLEEYLEDLIANANNPDLAVIDSSEGIETRPNAEAADHGHEGEAEAEGDHDHGEFDPHVWLDPKRAIQQVENIRDGLVSADPDGEAIYTANAAAYVEELQTLDRQITETLQPFVNREFVTYHDFAFYFADSYDLTAEYLVGVPEENPTPEDVKRVLASAESADVKTLLAEPQAGDGQFAALAKDLNVQVSTFDPMETSSPTGVEPDYYLTTMRQNVENLAAAFRGDAQSVAPVDPATFTLSASWTAQ